MKINKFFLSLAGATMLLASCGVEDLELGNSTTAPVSSSCPSVEFATSNNTAVEVDPSDTQFNLTVVRKDSAAAEYAIKVVENEDNTFEVPAKVAFAEGETSKDITVSIKDGAKQGEPIALELTFDDSLLNPYTVGYKVLSLTATIIKWETYGKGYWVGNIINTFYGVQSLPLAVDIEKAVTATSTKYRFVSPYGKVGEEQDELGAYLAYPYNEAGNVTGSNEKVVISVNNESKSASMAVTAIGANYGAGEMYMGSIYGNLSTDIASYPLGVFTASENGGKIVFAASTLFLQDNEGASPCSAGASTLYLSADDYKASDFYKDQQTEGGDEGTEEGGDSDAGSEE